MTLKGLLGPEAFRIAKSKVKDWFNNACEEKVDSRTVVIQI